MTDTTQSPPAIDLDKLANEVGTALAAAPAQEFVTATERMTSTPGADQIISQAGHALATTHGYAMNQIDDMITRLQNLKMKIELEREAAHQKMAAFVKSVATSSDHVNAIDKLTNDIEKKLDA